MSQTANIVTRSAPKRNRTAAPKSTPAQATTPNTAPPASETGKAASVRRFNEAAARTDTISMVTIARLCPSVACAHNIATNFGLDGIEGNAIREQTEEAFAASAKALDGALNDTALRIHLQRVVDGFVRSAHGAGNFYQLKAQAARDLSTALISDDSDRPGIDGTANRAERARDFAATAGLQAHALLCAAQGAADAYAEIVGEEWKPYAKNVATQASGERRAVSAQLAALG